MNAEFANDPAATLPSRTLLLWFAALLITWVSGIEPTWRKTQDIAHDFERVNWQRHAADRKAVEFQQAIELGGALLPALQKFKASYKNAEARDKERKSLYQALVAARAAPALKEYLKGTDVVPENDRKLICESPYLGPPVQVFKESTSDGLVDAISTLMRATDRLRNFCELERELDQLSPKALALFRENSAAIIHKGEITRQEELTDARTSARQVRVDANVDFELLGLNFKATPLLASLLWCAFGLTWLMLIGAELKANTQVSSDRHSKTVTAALALTMLTWAMGIRVAWVGLGIAQLQGNMQWKACVAIVLFLLALGSTCLVAALFAPKFISLLRSKVPPTMARKLTFGITVLSALVFVTIYWFPGQVVKRVDGMRHAIAVLGLLPVLAPRLFWVRQESAVTEPAITRRRAIAIGSAGLALIALTGLVKWQRYTHGHLFQRSAWFRSPRPPTQLIGAQRVLAPGFYKKAVRSTTKAAYEHISVLHYVSEDMRISRNAQFPRPFVRVEGPRYAWICGTRRASSPMCGATRAYVQTFNDSLSSPRDSRVAIATASWSFEHAAIHLLAVHGLTAKNVKGACAMLLSGIEHDVIYKRNHPRPRKRSAPSYRLYDLAAGLAVRFNQPQVLQELGLRIAQAGNTLIFQSRLTKWQDATSPWHSRWRDRQSPLRWAYDQQAAVF